MSDLKSETQRISTINLVRSSHPWTEADSAAGFVLRYIVPMRRQLIDVTGSSAAADGALKVLLAHLVSAGFGEHRKGRLRDFLLRAVRSSAKAHSMENGIDIDTLKLEAAQLESRQWLSYWRDGLLERAWRSLERHEHARPDEPVYTVLMASTSRPEAGVSELAAEIAEAGGRKLSGEAVATVLETARTMFAQLIADEVAETLDEPTREAVGGEIRHLGLGTLFDGQAVEG